MRALAALVLFAASPVAADAKFRVAAHATQVADPDAKVTMSTVDAALGTLRDRLDACVHGKLRSLAWIAFEKSKVVAVDVAGSADRTAEACLAGELKKLAVLDAVGRTAVVVAISASAPDAPAGPPKLDPFGTGDADVLRKVRALEPPIVLTGVGTGTKGIVEVTASGTSGHDATGRAGGVPHPVTVTIGDPLLDGTALTADEVKRVVLTRSGLYRACYQKELNHDPAIAGKLVLGLRIAKDGTVGDDVKVAESTVRSEPVESCIARVTRQLHFPAKGDVGVRVPIVLAHP